ncbi:MAG: S1 RNA-binding domain-containing protein, partial [Rhodospirillaceae bacterium]
MVKRMLVDATHPEETRVVVLDGTRLEEFDVETSTKKQIKGNIYLAKVVRVEPSLQAAFVDYGGNRHGFLAFSEIHPDYYQIPVADRERLLAQVREEEEHDAPIADNGPQEGREIVADQPENTNETTRTSDDSTSDVENEPHAVPLAFSPPPKVSESIDSGEVEPSAEAGEIGAESATNNEPVENHGALIAADLPINHEAADGDAPLVADGAVESSAEAALEAPKEATESDAGTPPEPSRSKDGKAAGVETVGGDDDDEETVV